MTSLRLALTFLCQRKWCQSSKLSYDISVKQTAMYHDIVCCVHCTRWMVTVTTSRVDLLHMYFQVALWGEYGLAKNYSIQSWFVSIWNFYMKFAELMQHMFAKSFWCCCFFDIVTEHCLNDKVYFEELVWFGNNPAGGC